MFILPGVNYKCGTVLSYANPTIFNLTNFFEEEYLFLEEQALDND